MPAATKLSLRRTLAPLGILVAAAVVAGPVSGAVAAPTTPTAHSASVVSASASKAVPKVVGKTAFAAKSALIKTGLMYKYAAPKGSFVVLSKNWTVVKQSPKAKTKVALGTVVRLTVVKTSTLGSGSSAAPATPAAPAAPAAPALTVAQQQAVLAAKGYLSMGTGFSHQGLIDQLSSTYGNGFSVADATLAVDSLNADYNAQAVLAAKGYLSMGGFSHASLVQQLSSPYGNKFTPEQAEYATTQVGL